jgi:hypothetical protein
MKLSSYYDLRQIDVERPFSGKDLRQILKFRVFQKMPLAFLLHKHFDLNILSKTEKWDAICDKAYYVL